MLSRAYELTGKKAEFKDMSVLCAKKFSKSKNPLVFEQMVRISLTGMIFRSSEEKCKVYLSLIDKLKR